MSSLIKNVAVAGAAGNLGPSVIEALLATGFVVTVLSRSSERDAALPSAVKTVRADYNLHDNLVSALQGQDAVVSLGVQM